MVVGCPLKKLLLSSDEVLIAEHRHTARERPDLSSVGLGVMQL